MTNPVDRLLADLARNPRADWPALITVAFTRAVEAERTACAEIAANVRRSAAQALDGLEAGTILYHRAEGAEDTASVIEARIRARST